LLESTVTAKGQTTLPKDVRRALGVDTGDKVRFVILDDEVRILRARPVAELAGILERPGKAPVSLDDMRAAIGEGAIAGAGVEK
jgi:antitoxin PrlF